MPYSPPSGDAVGLQFIGAYTPPLGSDVTLDFAPDAPIVTEGAVDGILADVGGGLTGLSCPSAWIAGDSAELAGAISAECYPPGGIVGVLDGVAGQLAGQSASVGRFSGGSLWLDGSDVYGMASPPSLVVATTDSVDGYLSALSTRNFIGVFDGVLEGLLGNGLGVNYDPQVWRGPSLQWSSSYCLDNVRANRAVGAIIKDGRDLHPPICPVYRSVQAASQDNQSAWHTTVVKPTVNPVRFATARMFGHAAQMPFKSPPTKHQRRFFGFQDGWLLADDVRFNVESATPHNLPYAMSLLAAKRASPSVAGPYGTSGYKGRHVRIPWQMADPHPWWPRTIRQPPPQPVYEGQALVFYQPLLDYYGGADLVFGFPCYAWPLGLKRRQRTGVTMLVHTILVTRWPDGTNIPASAISLQFDEDSWGWSATITLKTEAAVALVRPVDGEPRTLEITIDGFQVHVLAEDILPDRRFGSRVWQVSCRSPLAVFSSLYAPLRTRLVDEPMVAAQLVDLELANTGWTAEYHGDLNQLFAIDWLVPANVWGYQQQSPLDAILQIAGAVGARAYADNTANVVHIAPRYPVSPWDWGAATLDKTIPSSLVRFAGQRLGNKPAYNQVYASGQQGGVFVNAVRAGTSGDIRADMVVDRLITAVGAGRERARNIISSGGKQYLQTLELPVNVQTGVVMPGQLVGFEGIRGLGVGVSIEASISDNGVQAAQTVEVRVHL